ncbi:8128_t:CDS:2 [Ambispora gerdemannii]|uniref:8128_t:CDS:1 n=1 Tax=Ambispora gerdemannii TaxID=144530 RepID=A0A9N9F8K9_9GLOM|nr:8128_t:CDS:2 [Ambispora gerdemannii]
MATLDTAHNYSPTWLGLATQLGISASISLYCVLQFEWNRHRDSMQYLYTPRTRLSENASPPIPRGLFTWIKATVSLPEKFYLQNVGLDAVMYLRFLTMALKFLVFNVVVVCSILMPINYFGKGEEKGVQVFSVNNLTQNNYKYLWAHMICTYFVSISWMYFLYISYWDYMMMRKEYLMNKAKRGSVSARTVMVSRIPEDLRSEERLKLHFEALGIGQVESARLVRHIGKLNRKITRREKALLALEKAHIQLAKNVVYAIKKRKWYHFGVGFKPKHISSPKENNTANSNNDNDPSLELEAGNAKERQILQPFVDLLDRRKKKQSNTLEDQSTNKPSATSANTSTFSSSEDFLDQEDGYGRQFLIWEALAQLPKATLDKYQPTHRIGYFGTGTRVLSIDHFLKKFNFLDRRIAEIRAISVNERPPKPTSTGFVTFVNHTSANMAAQCIMSTKPHTLTTKMAPEPRDILWENISMRFREKMIRTWIVNASVWALTIFWLFPIFAFLTLTSIDSLSQRIHFLGPFLEARPIVRTLLQNVLPTVLVSFFMAMLPWILMEISKQESFPSYSELEEAVLIRYYHFSFFNVFIVFLLGITFLESIFDVINQPTSIIETLAKSLPQGATFFINYIIFNICTHGLELLQVGSQLFLHIILTSRFVATTPRMLQRVSHPWPFQFYYYYPNHILVLVITITYSTINPLILIFSLVYYAVAFVVYKHQFAYCYVRRYESGGKFYRRVFGYTTDGLIIYQLTMIGLIWLRTAIVAGAFLVPLLVGTVYFRYYCHKTFYSRTHYLALDTRLEMETAEKARQDEPTADSRIDDLTSNEKGLPVVIEQSEKEELEKKQESFNLNDSIEPIITQDAVAEHFNRLSENNGSMESISDNSTAIFKSSIDNSNNNQTTTSVTKHVEGPRVRLSLGQTTARPGQSLTDLTKDVSSGEQNAENTTTGRTTPILTLNTEGVHRTKDNIAPSGYKGITTVKPGPPKMVSTSNEPIPLNKKKNVADSGNDAETQKPILFSTSPTAISPNRTPSSFLNVPSHTPRTPSGFLARANLNLTHDPNLQTIQDDKSPYQTYFHPNLVKALNRKLWLPRNPLKGITVEDTVELDRALTSSEGGTGLVGYWGGASGFLGEARISMYDTTILPIFPGHAKAATDIGCGGGGNGNDNNRVLLHRRAITDPITHAVSPITRKFSQDGGGEYPFSPILPCSPEEEGFVNKEDFASGELESGELTSGETI